MWFMSVDCTVISLILRLKDKNALLSLMLANLLNKAEPLKAFALSHGNLFSFKIACNFLFVRSRPNPTDENRPPSKRNDNSPS